MHIRLLIVLFILYFMNAASGIPMDPDDTPHDGWMSKNNVMKYIDDLVDEKMLHSSCTDMQKSGIKLFLKNKLNSLDFNKLSKLDKRKILDNSKILIETYKNSVSICQPNDAEATYEEPTLQKKLKNLNAKLCPIWPFC